MDDQLLAFIGVSVTVAVIPGPDMALVARNVIRHGRSAGFATSIGICTGILAWAMAAGVGLSTLIAKSEVAFVALKVAGAIYLVYLGIATLRGHDMPLADSSGRHATVPWHRAWRQGLLSAILNPKLGVFFLALLPAFVGRDDPPELRALQLAVLFNLIGLVWLIAFTVLVDALGRALDRPRAQRYLRWLTGTLLIGFGARIALDRS